MNRYDLDTTRLDVERGSGRERSHIIGARADLDDAGRPETHLDLAVVAHLEQGQLAEFAVREAREDDRDRSLRRRGGSENGDDDSPDQEDDHQRSPSKMSPRRPDLLCNRQANPIRRPLPSGDVGPPQ